MNVECRQRQVTRRGVCEIKYKRQKSDKRVIWPNTFFGTKKPALMWSDAFTCGACSLPFVCQPVNGAASFNLCHTHLSAFPPLIGLHSTGRKLDIGKGKAFLHTFTCFCAKNGWWRRGALLVIFYLPIIPSALRFCEAASRLLSSQIFRSNFKRWIKICGSPFRGIAVDAVMKYPSRTLKALIENKSQRHANEGSGKEWRGGGAPRKIFDKFKVKGKVDEVLSDGDDFHIHMTSIVCLYSWHHIIDVSLVENDFPLNVAWHCRRATKVLSDFGKSK